MNLTSLDQLLSIAKSRKIKKIAVAAADDKHVLKAVKYATSSGIIVPVLIGNEVNIYTLSENLDFDLTNIEIINEPNPEKACVMAVDLLRNGDAHILMKGMVNTSTLLHVVLDKGKGLRKSDILSHVALFETPHYPKLLAITDAAMNISPGLNEKVAIINNAVELFHKLGMEKPKTAVIGAVEAVNPKMEATIHASLLTMMNQRGQIKGCIVDGPLALDNAVSKEAAHQKGLDSEVAGDADIIVVPDINSGNVLYKSLNFLGGGTSAAVIMGAQVPVVLTSRADSEKSKYMSIILAAAME